MPSRHSVLNHVGCPTVALSVALAPRVCSRLRHERAGSPQPSAESGSLSYGLPVHLQMLSTPPHGDAVTFDYGVATNSGTDSHRSVKASSRTHSSAAQWPQFEPCADELLPNLIKRGFPEPDPDTGMFDLDATALGGGAAAPTPARGRPVGAHGRPLYPARRGRAGHHAGIQQDQGPSGQGVNRFCNRNGKRKGSIGKHLPAWDEKAMEIDRADVAELVDARDLK